jgi:hypothetical protein
MSRATRKGPQGTFADNELERSIYTIWLASLTLTGCLDCLISYILYLCTYVLGENLFQGNIDELRRNVFVFRDPLTVDIGSPSRFRQPSSE